SDPSLTSVADGRQPAVGAKILLTSGRVASERQAGGNSMAARGSGGLLLCMGLLLAMPALAATPTDRSECAASADKPDVGWGRLQPPRRRCKRVGGLTRRGLTSRPLRIASNRSMPYFHFLKASLQ